MRNHHHTPSNLLPTVILSACLNGERVRYDGKDKSLGSPLDTLKQQLNVIPFCPEVAAGMGVPRPPVQWVLTQAQGLQLQQVDQPENTYHEALTSACLDWCQRLASSTDITPPLIAILKARSPSCGAGNAPQFNSAGDIIRFMDGAFVQALRQYWPSIMLLDESLFEETCTAQWLCQLMPLIELGQIGSTAELRQLLTMPTNTRSSWWLRNGLTQ